MTEPVLVVGAGPTGLVLALWLTKLGARVRIVDRAAGPGTTSRAVGVQARTLELYRQVGLAQTVVDAGVKTSAVNLWAGGKPAARVPIAEIGKGLSPYPFVLMYPQDAHEQLLIERLRAHGVEVERGTSLVSFEEYGAGLRARLQRADGSVETCVAAYLCGCDGAHSTVRQALGIGFRGGTYEHLFYVADVQASGKAANGEVHVEVEEADFLAAFPLSAEGHVRLVGAVRWDQGRERRDLTFDDVRQRPIEDLQLTVNRVNWFSTYHVHHRVAEHFQRGRAFLLGDAGHVHSPVGAQGMNTGIGDAVNLAWKLAAVLAGGPESLLATYEPERIAFARRLVATTDRLFTVVSGTDWADRFVRARLVPFVAPTLLHFAPLRRLLFSTVSQIDVAYPDSALSAGSAGDVRGGQRLPWVEAADGSDNFAPLDATEWQVHVYGEPRAELRTAADELHLPLHAFSWTPAADDAGLARDAAYLVRPDGYVALADASAGGDRLRDYCRSRGLR